MGSEQNAAAAEKDVSTAVNIELRPGEGLPERGSAEKKNEDTSKNTDNREDGDDGDPGYPKGVKLILLTVSLMLAVFIMALDTTIIATAVPKITTQFHSIDDIGWYTSAYLLPLMALQPTFGKVYSFFKVKPVFLAAVLTFEVGSIICASAPSSGVFIFGRVVAGTGAAAVWAGGMVIILSAVPLNRISVYLSILSSMFAAAALSGPPLGGLFTDSARLTWRFCFWVNLPIGFISTTAFWAFASEPKRQSSTMTAKQMIAQLDLGGTVLFVSSIVLFFIALQFGGNAYAWRSAPVIVCFVLSGICLISFIFLQSHLQERATIPPHIFLNRSVTCSVLVAALMSMSVNTHTFYLPFYFQSAKGTTAVSSGLRLLPYSMSVNATELVVGAGSSFLGLFLPFMYAGTALFTVAAGLLCTLNIGTATVRLVGFQILAGVGIGSSMQLCATSTRAATDAKDAPIAATLSVFAPFFGSSIGAAISQNIFRITLKDQLLRFLSGDVAAAVIEAGGTGIDEVTNAVTKTPVTEAYSYALAKVFILPAVAGGMAFVGTLCIKWRTLREEKKPAEDGSAAENAVTAANEKQ